MARNRRFDIDGGFIHFVQPIEPKGGRTRSETEAISFDCLPGNIFSIMHPLKMDQPHRLIRQRLGFDNGVGDGGDAEDSAAVG